MGDPTLSPYVRDLVAKLAPIESRLAALDLEIAAREEERAGLRSTLAGISRALDPEQVTLPLPGLGSSAPPLRSPSRMAEILLRQAEGVEGSMLLSIERDSVNRGELNCARSLAKGPRPLLVEASMSADEVVYRLTLDGETVARALPVIVTAEAST